MAGKATGPVRFVIVTLDAHLADAFEAARGRLQRAIPGLELSMHVAADWASHPGSAERCRQEIAQAHFIACTQLFQEEYAKEVTAAVAARRADADMVFVALCAPELMQQLTLGKFRMGGPANPNPWSPVNILKKLRGSREDGKSSGERQMTMLRQLPKLLRFVPGTAQDVRAWFLGMQYWLAGTEENIEQMVKYLIDRYAAGPRAALKGTLKPQPPEEIPEVGVWHPDLPGKGLAEARKALPARGTAGTVGVIVGRSYLLARNTRHYAAVVRALEARGLNTVPVYASALDARPAMDAYFKDAKGRATVDAVVNLTGFALVGGPAYSDSAKAVDALSALDVPYLTLQTLEFQTIGEWEQDARGLNPLQATLQVAIPELDGAVNSLVYGGKGGTEGGAAASEPIASRVEVLAARVARLIALRRTPREQRKVAIILFNFPPNSGNTGSAAYIAVFNSLQRVLASLKEQGYQVELPSSADDLRERITVGNAMRYGAPANVAATIPADDHVRREPWLKEIEATWGPAPGKQLTDGRQLFVMGAHFGNVFVGVQPSFGWEGDPMRLLFEGNFAPTHAFSAFYRWLKEDYAASVVLHFGTHGALEFMPGKQAGLCDRCWPERLIGDLPNVYLYASNNSSEGTLAKRRGGATTVTYLTPPISNAGLYKGLAELKASLDRFRGLDAAQAGEAQSLLQMIQEQAATLDLAPAEPAWTPGPDADAAVAQVREKLLELEYALIPVGLHTVGEAMDPAARRDTLLEMARVPRPDRGLPSLVEALGGAGLEGERLAAAETAAREIVERVVETGRGDWAREGWVRSRIHGGVADIDAAAQLVTQLAEVDALLREDHELPGILKALDGRYIAPAPGGDLLRNPQVLPTGRNLYGFDPYRVPSAFALLEGRARAELLLKRHAEDGHAFPETVAFVLWGTDNMKSEGAPLAQVLALMGVAPRFDSVGRLCGARLMPLAQLGRPRVDVVVTLSGIFRDLLPLQVKLLAEAALLCAQADEPDEQNFIRKHARATMAETGCDLATAALRVFSNADGAYGSNVNLLVETGQWSEQDELADQFVKRKGFAYGVNGVPAAQPALMQRLLGTASLTFQNIDSVDLGATDIDQYVESLGGMQRVAERARGEAIPVYLGDHTAGGGKVRTLTEQVALETRTRMLNPKWYEAQLQSGYEGVRNLAGHVTTTFGWSATAGEQAVPQWVYTDISKTFVLDAAMRERIARMNPSAAAGMAQRLLEANDRGFWRPDPEVLAQLRDAAAELEDRLEGVTA